MTGDEILRELLCSLGNHVRDAVIRGRNASSAELLSAVAAETASDTIYQIDRVSEEAIADWLSTNWPESEPVALVMEGIEENETPVFPKESLSPKWVLIMDPIDGTRGIMTDKRPAWVLSALAPIKPGAPCPRLKDLRIAAMTEIPVSKQTLCDQVSGIAGHGLEATRLDLVSKKTSPLAPRPSKASDFRHGFASFAKFFPEGRALTARLEEKLWDRLIGLGKFPSPVIFDDQYISTGGQFYELITGRDRMVADIRPLVFQRIGMVSSLVCHPYDACCWPLLQEAGVVFCDLDGNFPDAPLDTTSPVSWLAFANDTLARSALPVIREIWRDQENL